MWQRILGFRHRLPLLRLMGFGGILSRPSARSPQRNQCPGQVRFMQPVHMPTVAQQQGTRVRGLNLKERPESPWPMNHPQS